MIKADVASLVNYAQRLKVLSKSAYPVVVRQTLTSAAYDMKKVSILKVTGSTFTIRKANFFKATSTVRQAQGFDLDTMQSVVGFNGNTQAIDDLEEQEQGGLIPGRGFIPMDPARAGNNKRKLVRPNAQLKAIKFADQKNAQGSNDGQKFLKSVLFVGVGGFVMGEYEGKSTLWRVNKINAKDLADLKLTPIYSYRKGRQAPVKATHFAQRAATITRGHIFDMFKINAEKKFAQALKV
jgi:hypothetical protein